MTCPRTHHYNHHRRPGSRGDQSPHVRPDAEHEAVQQKQAVSGP